MQVVQVLYKNYLTGEVGEIGRIIERRRFDRGHNYLDLLRKARLQYSKKVFDIAGIFLGRAIAEISLSKQLQSRYMRLVWENPACPTDRKEKT